MSSDREPVPDAPGYGDQGPAGGGRERLPERPDAEPEPKPQPGDQDRLSD